MGTEQCCLLRTNASHRIASHPQVVFAVCVSSGCVHNPNNLDIEPPHSVQLNLDDWLLLRVLLLLLFYTFIMTINGHCALWLLISCTLKRLLLRSARSTHSPRTPEPTTDKATRWGTVGHRGGFVVRQYIVAQPSKGNCIAFKAN